jgi:nucleoid DNA-binding protein
MILDKNLEEKILKDLIEKKKCILKGIGTLYVKPARKGVINSPFGKIKRFDKRVTFKCSRVLKNTINGN